MLQLPSPAPRRFTKAQIADMTRGGKVVVRVKKVKPKVDPLIALIEKADAALERYVLAYNSHAEANEALAKEDRGWPWVTPIDELIPTLSHGDRFHSTAHINTFFAKRRKHALSEIKHARESLRKLRKGVGAYQINLELTQRIEGNKKHIALLTKHKEAQKKAFRTEERRLNKVQRAVRLVEKRKAKSEATAALRALTDKIATMQPTSKWGAIALLSYVELRCRDDLAEFFVEGGFFEAKLQRLIGRARSFLSRNS